MRQFGVKLWSRDFVKNPDFANQSIKAVKEGLFDYVELFAVPNTYEDYHQKVEAEMSGLKVIIHAPHSVFGLDTGNRERFSQNLADLKASRQYADSLKADIIILHPGFNEEEKYLEESCRQFKLFNESRLAVENLPSYCSSTGKTLHGSSPLQIKKIISESGCQFCLDFAHAICAANAYGREISEDLTAYQALHPVMYHMSDGNWGGDEDEHLHYGEGNYPLAELLNQYTNADTFITMETGHDIPTDIRPWVDDIKYLKSLLKK